MVNSIKLTLYDRGFYSRELMLSLNNSYCPYLIFVPKNDQVKRELETMDELDKKIVPYEFKLNKDGTTQKVVTTQAFLKQVFDPKSQQKLDWAFATNQPMIDLNNIISTYKRRWGIETGFRVQDEARIKSKSKDAKVRFFYFVYEQVLQLLWAVLYKDEVECTP